MLFNDKPSSRMKKAVFNVVSQLGKCEGSTFSASALPYLGAVAPLRVPLVTHSTLKVMPPFRGLRPQDW